MRADLDTFTVTVKGEATERQMQVMHLAALMRLGEAASDLRDAFPGVDFELVAE